MNIAYIIVKGFDFPAGIERYTLEVASRLAKRGHNVLVYAIKHYNKSQLNYNFKVKNVPSLKSKSFEKLTATLFATIHLISNYNPDIVHYHAFGQSSLCIIPRLFGKKVIVQGHGIEWKRTKWGPVARIALKLLERPSILWANAVTVVSKTQQEYILKNYGVKADWIPTGVNKPVFRRPELIKNIYGLKGEDYILFASRLVKEKGAHYLIDAFKSLKTDLKLVIAGDAPYEDSYKMFLRERAAGDRRILFTGFVTGQLLQELLSNAFLFVLPSDLEGLPTVLLEAMSYGNLCLVSDIPENLEALSGLGYTFKAGSVESLREKINDIISNPDYSLKERAKRFVLEHYTWDKISDRLEQLYFELVSGGVRWKK